MPSTSGSSPMMVRYSFDLLSLGWLEFSADFTRTSFFTSRALGSGGGTAQSMSIINNALALSRKAATIGYYAQAIPGIPFTGSQLTDRMADIVNSGAVFQPAVMPVGGWQGFTWDDTSQADRISKVMQTFVDQGVTGEFTLIQVS